MNKKNFLSGKETIKYEKEEKNRGRWEKRIVEISKPNGIDTKKWKWLKTIIKVERRVREKWRESKEEAYYISSLDISNWPEFFWKGIRGHRWIEAFHYTKDVSMKEDEMKVKNKTVSALYSIMRNIVLNIFRHHSIKSIKATLEKCANNPKYILSLF